MILRISFVLLCSMTVYVGAANILGLFLTHSASHVIIHTSLARALVEQGHNVTVITSLPIREKNPGYRHILLKDQEKNSDARVVSLVNGSKEVPNYLKPLTLFYMIKNLATKYPDFTLDPAFVNFIKENNHFDLLILGYVFNDFQLGVAAHFKCPVVLSIVIQPFGQLSRLMGNPTNPEFVPLSPFMSSKPMNFIARVQNFILSFMEWILAITIDWESENLYNKNFPADKYPSYWAMKENVSLMLFNHHFSEGPVRPLVPGLVEMGGIQIKDKPDPLPKDIEEFLNNSPKGAIFFSLGSNVRSQNLGERALKIIFNVLSKLPYNVIWKHESNSPRNSSNILFKTWLPQDDILAHKNVKLFVTHAGKGSITESEYHGVPMVAIPVVGDQHVNGQTMASKGHGVLLDYKTMTEESFRAAILDVIENVKYKETVLKFSQLYRDRPLTARENAVFWIEYVLRHRGAGHMQSPLKNLNLIQRNSIDVILFLSVVCYVILYVIKFVLRLVLKSLWNVKSLKKIKQK